MRKESTVVIANSVNGHSPWYMGPLEEQLRVVNTAPEAIRPFLLEFVYDGVILVENAVSKEQCDAAMSAFDAMVKRNCFIFDQYRDENGYLSRIINLHIALEEFEDIYLRNRALPLLTFIFGAKPSLYTTLYFQRGSQQEIHRDTPFFSTVPPYYYVGFWTALEAATVRNGALRVIRSGHLRPEPDLEKIAKSKYAELGTIDPGDPDLWNLYQKQVLEDCLAQGLTIETLEVPKGATVIWHPQLPHGGSAILDPSQTRNSLVVHTTPSGTPVYHQNAFFNPTEKFVEEPQWTYWVSPEANILKQTHIDIMHKRQVAAGDLL